jgi:hypothetical protein
LYAPSHISSPSPEISGLGFQGEFPFGGTIKPYSQHRSKRKAQCVNQNKDECNI